MQNKLNKRKIGQDKEKLACEYLKENGLEIIETNYRTVYEEIDIIAKEDNTLVFVEVSIFMDAYFAPNKPMPKSWYIIMTLLGITMLIRFFVDNDDWYRVMNLAAGLFVLIVMASLLVKKLISKKEEKEDNEEIEE